jgi:plasmid stabilization system protein ParE
MSGYIISPEAENDAFEIWRYLAEKASVPFADRTEEVLFDAFALLARNPGLGHERRDLTTLDVFFYRVFPYQYMVIYRRRIPLEIVAILHGRRDVGKILEGRQER